MILLNIQTSPRGSNSISIASTDAFVEAYRAAHPGVTVAKESHFPFDGEGHMSDYR
jgi:FMN-dependent NADH-azoreductase